MRSLASNVLLFAIGVLAGVTVVLLINIPSKGDKRQESDAPVDLMLGKTIIMNVGIYDIALQDLRSNSVEHAKSVLTDFEWWQLEEAWEISKKYDNALDSELRPLLSNVYPQLRRDVDLHQATKSYPQPFLVEMTNFMLEAEGRKSVVH